jgi:ATP phosphoribosyltransferase
MKKNHITIAVPKGRILEELQPIMLQAGIIPEDDFFNKNSRKLQFNTNNFNISIIRVRSFDVATFVAFGAAQIGIAGSDVLAEFNFPDIYAPLDLGIGKCRLSIATLVENQDDNPKSHITIATKYPNITEQYFANQNIQAECIKLSGAMELAPKLGLCEYIVDLVSSGATLKANGLIEVKKILDISSKLIVNRTAFKTNSEIISQITEDFRKQCN